MGLELRLIQQSQFPTLLPVGFKARLCLVCCVLVAVMRRARSVILLLVTHKAHHVGDRYQGPQGGVFGGASFSSFTPLSFLPWHFMGISPRPARPALFISATYLVAVLTSIAYHPPARRYQSTAHHLVESDCLPKPSTCAPSFLAYSYPEILCPSSGKCILFEDHRHDRTSRKSSIYMTGFALPVRFRLYLMTK